jgi:hypothetical protein
LTVSLLSSTVATPMAMKVCCDLVEIDQRLSESFLFQQHKRDASLTIAYLIPDIFSASPEFLCYMQGKYDSCALAQRDHLTCRGTRARQIIDAIRSLFPNGSHQHSTIYHPLWTSSRWTTWTVRTLLSLSDECPLTHNNATSPTHRRWELLVKATSASSSVYSAFLINAFLGHSNQAQVLWITSTPRHLQRSNPLHPHPPPLIYHSGQSAVDTSRFQLPWTSSWHPHDWDCTVSTCFIRLPSLLYSLGILLWIRYQF